LERIAFHVQKLTQFAARQEDVKHRYLGIYHNLCDCTPSFRRPELQPPLGNLVNNILPFMRPAAVLQCRLDPWAASGQLKLQSR
jgi:hypothetical protein